MNHPDSSDMSLDMRMMRLEDSAFQTVCLLTYNESYTTISKVWEDTYYTIYPNKSRDDEGEAFRFDGIGENDNS